MKLATYQIQTKFQTSEAREGPTFFKSISSEVPPRRFFKTLTSSLGSERGNFIH
ncbi:MAG: hypothetical protein ACTS4T_01820 [Candidatus Hodgkinia cicadicola]